MNKICIITTRHISYNPRVLKEADALHCAGYEVCVVTVNNHLAQSDFDKEIMAVRKWQLKTVNFRKELPGEKFLWLKLSLLHKFFNALQKLVLRFGIAERSVIKGYGELKNLAVSQKADLYIAHHAEALAIGYWAAKKNKAKWSFDAEDFHSGMNENISNEAAQRAVVFLESKYLHKSNYMTAASIGIGDAYKSKYGLASDIAVILNVFPREEKINIATNQIVKFYWYSQVIGPTRNLENLIAASGKLSGNFELHLRGSFYSKEYMELLKQMAIQHNISGKISFHKPILAVDIITDASKYDIGLALESNVSVNRNICVTNKVFAYLMAGLAIVGTDTAGQKEIFSHFPGAVRICKMDDVEDLAKAMQYFIDHPEKLLAAKQSARSAAVDRFNWEVESGKFLDIVKKVIAA